MSWSDLYFLSEWAVRLMMLVYVPQRRSPSAARTWLLLIFLLPWPGLFLYGVFGRAHLSRKRIELQSRVSEFFRRAAVDFFGRYRPEHPLPDPFREAARLAERLGDFPVTAGNRVEWLADYDGALDRLAADIGAARRHVHLLYYIFADDPVGGRLADALSAAVARGVRCLVLVDAQGSRGARRSLLPRLRASGVEVHELLPVGLFRRQRSRFDLRNHRKIAVVDGTVGYVGSQNLVDATFKPGLVYEELVARFVGPVVSQLQAVLLADHYYETEARLTDSTDLFPAPAAAGEIAAQTLPSGPGYRRENGLRLITSLVYDARRTVVVTTPYFIPDETLLRALTTAALRGVRVRLIVSRKYDQFLVGFAQRSYYEELLEAGVEIHLYEAAFLHAKHLSIDGRVVLVGSSNMDLRSFALNAEVSVLVYGAEAAAGLEAIEEHRLARATRLSLDAWRLRPRYQQWGENICRLVDSLL